MSRSRLILLSLSFFALIFIGSSFFIVREIDQAVVLRLGKPQRVIRDPGLALKVPFIENVILIDKRALDLDMPAQEVLSTDQLRLVVDAFARFRILDPLRAYQTVRGAAGVSDRLSGILASKLRDELGKQPFAALLSPERGELMDTIQRAVNVEARKYGAEIIDVRIKRADLPAGLPLNSAFERMRTARDQEARSIRAQGIKQAEIIRADADSQGARIYAESFGKDPNFYAFYRSMQAYRKSMTAADTTVVMSPDNGFLAQFGGGGK